MRRKNPKPKEKLKVPIPAELREAVSEAREIIQEADLDPDGLGIDFGDAIQTDVLCGGRTPGNRRPFEFTFYPPDDADRGRWFFSLDETEVEDIADGVMSEITMFCCTLPDCRCKFRDESQACFYCDYEEVEA